MVFGLCFPSESFRPAAQKLSFPRGTWWTAGLRMPICGEALGFAPRAACLLSVTLPGCSLWNVP